MDFAARGDLTVIVVLELSDVLWLRELVEMRRTSFAEQLSVLDRIMKEYRVSRAALDQTGLGEMPVEEAKRRHGQYRVEGALFIRSAQAQTWPPRSRNAWRSVSTDSRPGPIAVDLHSVQGAKPARPERRD
jgi:phage FluMu gp28-like protein